MNVARIGSSSATNFKGANAEKIFSKAANINSWQQRLALGVSAMAIQPAIDRLNNNVDPKTREMSAARSLAKGLVGMTTGIIVRGGCMKAVETSLKKDKMVDKLAKIVTKENTDAAISKTKDYIKNQGGAKQYASVIGTVIALGVMLFTNFLVDAPLTNWLTNKFSKGDKNKSNDIQKTNTNLNNPLYNTKPQLYLKGAAK